MFGTAPAVQPTLNVNRELWGVINEVSDDESSDDESDSDTDSDLSDDDDDEAAGAEPDASGFESIQSGIT